MAKLVHTFNEFVNEGKGDTVKVVKKKSKLIKQDFSN